ncbi:MAG: hydantoinase/carbamoylase family amidase [Pararhodobacter sp.]|nr:hydantoinase/carbamoylase family amidase [Pararhodobacter sp.]
MSVSLDRIRAAVIGQQSVGERFLDRLSTATADEVGVTRDSYGEGEARAHAILADMAGELGLDLRVDAAGNSYATLPGTDAEAPSIIIGSHLDSVPQGGNFDGAAGVAAGLVICAALRQINAGLARNVTVMGIRAEESIWFPCSYIGSRAALGTLPHDALDTVRRSDTGRTLAEHIAAAGGDVEQLRSGRALLDPADIHAYIELHIEQAPVLHETGLPLAICTGIPGNFRHPHAQISGRDDHVGTPRRFRRDAAMAAAALAMAVDNLWATLEAQNVPVAMTFGRFHTDPKRHGMTVVPGRFLFSLDIRAYDHDVLKRLEADLHRLVEQIAAQYRVNFDLGPRTTAGIGRMDTRITKALTRLAEEMSLPHMPLESPGSHDAAAFADAGVPTAMLLVRNENGSHNPDEHMEIADLIDACALATGWILRDSGLRTLSSGNSATP